jgi:hypothetical protein
MVRPPAPHHATFPKEECHMAAKKNTANEEITDILKVTTGTFECCIVGTSPLILNRMSEKAKHELLMPKGRKNATERATTLKHVPVEEYRASTYTLKDTDQPTLLALLSTSFKGALRSAALDMPGAKKAQIGRLTYIAGEYVGIYGVPKLFMSITRSADMNKTPDVRTRAIVPEWACVVRVTFVQPLIRAQAVANLLAAAGITIGVGDWRPEKGSGSYGQFRIADKTDPDFVRILKAGARKAQVSALEHPVCYDDETSELLSWFDSERAQRKLKGVA